MKLNKPVYVVKRAEPGKYKILVGNLAHFVSRKGRFWYSNGNYYTTLRDSIISVIK